MSKQDLILHPVRLRILMAVAGREMTVSAIAQQLPDVAQATLYRHVNTLAEAGVLQVVAENPVRGTVEKTYALPDPSIAHLTPDDVREASKEDHQRFFTAFLGMLSAQFARYLDTTETPDFVADGVGYQSLPLYLSDAEFADFQAQINSIFLQYMDHEPAPERQRRLVSITIMPDTPT